MIWLPVANDSPQLLGKRSREDYSILILNQLTPVNPSMPQYSEIKFWFRINHSPQLGIGEKSGRKIEKMPKPRDQTTTKKYTKDSWHSQMFLSMYKQKNVKIIIWNLLCQSWALWFDKISYLYFWSHSSYRCAVAKGSHIKAKAEINRTDRVLASSRAKGRNVTSWTEERFNKFTQPFPG